MVSANTWRRSRIIWISLFLIANALDAITTFVELSDAESPGLELNPIVHYFGWPAAIIVRIAWIYIIAKAWTRGWQLYPSYRITLMAITTFIMLVALFNIGQGWNPDFSNKFRCSIISTKYVQTVLENQFNIKEIEGFVYPCP